MDRFDSTLDTVEKQIHRLEKNQQKISGHTERERERNTKKSMRHMDMVQGPMDMIFKSLRKGESEWGRSNIRRDNS